MKILATLFFAGNAQIFTPGGKCATVPVIADFDAGRVGKIPRDFKNRYRLVFSKIWTKNLEFFFEKMNRYLKNLFKF